jgi:hypothetical protein
MADYCFSLFALRPITGTPREIGTGQGGDAGSEDCLQSHPHIGNMCEKVEAVQISSELCSLQHSPPTPFPDTQRGGAQPADAPASLQSTERWRCTGV